MSKSETHSNYMDGIKVKISEKYKPPPRINLATTYSQRISLNKQLQDNLPVYDFTLEATIKEKMKEWRTARNLISIDRKEKLDKIKEERRKKAEEELLKKKEKELNQMNDINLESKQSSYTSGGVLIPTQVTGNNYTNILTPIPLSAQTNSCLNSDKSPINISDFEQDTCSPFDKVELNTINDIEELKLVLQNERTNVSTTQTNFPVTNNLQSYPPTGMKYYNYQTPHGSNQSYPVTSVYSNGFNYYTPEVSLYNNTYNYNTSLTSKTDVSTNVSTFVDDNKSFKKVPDIMRSLQNELSNTRISNINLAAEGNVSSPVKVSDGLENPFEQLPRSLQDVCKRISLMGFPLARVARACKDFGDDDKKIIEHLLAMSQLLDLGFAEKQVSSALLQCNNDRDKALELLIS